MMMNDKISEMTDEDLARLHTEIYFERAKRADAKALVIVQNLSDEEIVNFLKKGDKIGAIRYYRGCTNVDLLIAKAVIDECERRMS